MSDKRVWEVGRSVKSKTKTMLIVYVDVCRIIHKTFVPPNQTIKAVF